MQVAHVARSDPLGHWVGPASNGLQERCQAALDGCNRLLVGQGGVDVAAEVGGHLRPRLADDQDVLLAFETDEIAGFKDDIVARRGNRGAALSGKVVVPW